MDLLKKIEQLKNAVDKFENLTEDLNEYILSKQKKIEYLKKEIRENSEKIDKIVENYNADSEN